MKKGILKKLIHASGKAIYDYGMIEHNDRILVCVSGGFDSLALLSLLGHFQKTAPVTFDLFPIYVDPGFEDGFAGELKKYVLSLHGNMQVLYTDHGIQAHGAENRENPCFLCSRLRRKSFFTLAAKEGCTKIALGHNKDDIIETLLINMCYSGRIGTMLPCQTFFDGRISIIRPLSYVEKNDIIKFAMTSGFPEFINPCPSDGITKRSSVRNFLRQLYNDNKHIKGNLFRSMSNVQTDYLLKSKKND